MPNSVSRRHFLQAIGATSLAALGRRTWAASPDEPPTRPNIVMVYADDLDFDELSVYAPGEFPCYTGAWQGGHTKFGDWGPHYADPRMLTPNIERLAAEGAVFDRFYITSSICTPSRYSVLTGRYASRSPGFCESNPPGGPACIRWNTPLSADESNVARELGKLGYATGMIGKWHNGAPHSKARGIAGDADPYDPEVERKLRAAYDRGIAHLVSNMGFDLADRVYFGNKASLGLPESMRVHNLEWFTEGALQFIEKYHQQPFLLYMPLTVPHSQYYVNQVKGDPLATPAGMLDEAPDVQPSRESIFQRLKEKGIPERHATATWIDDAVGALLSKLEALGIADNTMFIFASDHQSRGKYTCSEGARVPFIVRWPGAIEPGTRVEALCANIDLAPTFIEMAGGSPPAYMTQDGRSLLPVFDGTVPQDWRDALLLEVSNIRAAVGDRYKLVANRPPPEIMERMEAEARQCAKTGERRQISWDGQKNPHKGAKGVRYQADRDFPAYFDKDQLYDLENDPFEQDNLADDPGHAAIVERMKQALSELLAPLPHTFGEFKTA